MPKLKPDTQRARRDAILDAAELCFARSGFHRCTMQAICKEAGISPGALYVYFASKEDLIAGLAERDRGAFQERFAPLGDANDILNALRVVRWRDIAGIPWDVVALYASACALGKGLAVSGAALYLADSFVKLLPDGWTVVTKDHSVSAQWEHTILVTDSGHEVLTRRPDDPV